MILLSRCPRTPSSLSHSVSWKGLDTLMVVIAAHSLPPARLTSALVLQAAVLLRLLPPPALTLSASVGGQGPHSVWKGGEGALTQQLQE